MGYTPEKDSRDHQDRLKKGSMKVNKKTLLTFGTITAIAAPVVAVVSCASDKGYLSYTFKKEDGKPSFSIATNYFDAFDFGLFENHDPKAKAKPYFDFSSDPVMFRSPFYSALAQGMSFLYNLVRELGFKWNEHGIKSDYLKSGNMPDISDKKHFPDSQYKDPKTLNAPKKVKDNIDGFAAIIKEANGFVGGVSEYMKDWINYHTGENYKDISSLSWNGVSLVNASNRKFNDAALGNYQARNADPATQKSKFIPGYDKLSPIDKKAAIFRALNDMKVFDGKSQSYNMFGLVTKKIAVQLYPDKKDGVNGYNLVSWHYSEGFFRRTRDGKDRDNAKFGLKMIHRIQDKLAETNETVQKVLGNTWLDPLSEDGVMSSKAFSTLGLTSHYVTGAPGDETGSLRDGIFTDGRDSDKNIQIYRYSSFIDGEHPGRLLFQMFANTPGKSNYADGTFHIEEDENPFALPMVHTGDNFYQTFYKIKKDEKIDELVNLLYYTLKNMLNQMEVLKNTARYQLELLENFASPIFVGIKNYLHDSNILKGDEKTVKKRIRAAFDKINNGSHYMLAVEIFMRGLKNIPMAFRPRSSVRHNSKEILEIVGMANTTSIYDSMLNFAANISERNTIIKDGEDPKLYEYKGPDDDRPYTPWQDDIPFNPRSPSVWYRFDPKTNNGYWKRSADWSTEEILKLKGNDGSIMHGRELPAFGGRNSKIKFQTDVAGKLEDLKKKKP